jgi:hypothetical protein
MRHVRLTTPTLPEEREGEDFEAYLDRVVNNWDPYGLFGFEETLKAKKHVPVRGRRWRRMSMLI